MSIEKPNMPPEGNADKGRIESADLDIEQLGKYLSDTVFESKKHIEEFLSQSDLIRKESIGHLEMGMTWMMHKDDLLNPTKDGRIGREHGSHPLSEHEAEAVLRKTVHGTGGAKYDLRIFKVFNRNIHYRYEYILEEI